MSDAAVSSDCNAARVDLLIASMNGRVSWQDTSSTLRDTEIGSRRKNDTEEMEDHSRHESDSEGYEESEDIEPTPLEYGRTNGLMRNHMIETYDEVENLPSTTFTISQLNANLPQFSLGDEFRLAERLSITLDGAALLESIAQQETLDMINSMIAPMLELKSATRRMKLELPLLKSDNRTDCKNFGRRENFEMNLKDIKLPLEGIREEIGRGLSWSPESWDTSSQLLDRLEKERLSIPRDTISYLAGAVSVDWHERDNQIIFDNEVKYRKNIALEPVTPPLSPVYVKPQPFEPSSTDSAFDVPLMSDPLSPTKTQLEEIENKIFTRDVPTPLRHHMQLELSSSTPVQGGTATLGEIYSPLAFMDDSDPPAIQENERMRREDLKIAELLTPEGPPTYLPKAVHFDEVIEELMIDSSQCQPNSPEFENRFFEESFGPAAELLNQKLEQEKLIAADATARVDVPLMDFSKADPPWTKFASHKDPSSLLDLQKSFLQEIIGLTQNWPGGRKGDLKLRWVPWNKDQARFTVNEHIEADPGMLETFLTCQSSQDVIDSSNLAWKPSGLMILQLDEDDDDEIEPGCFVHDTSLDITSLIKKRKRELAERASAEIELQNTKQVPENDDRIDEPQSPAQKSLGLSSLVAAANQSHKRYSSKNDVIPAGDEMTIASNEQIFGGLLGRTFSAEAFLDNYLEVRGNKKVKLTETSYFGGKTTKTIGKSVTIQEENLATQQKPPLKKAGPIPAPSMPPQTSRSTVIIASSLIRQRSLIRQLQKLLPFLELVERDFSGHNTTAWMPGSVTRSPIVSPLAAEADLIVSASTGILVTNLQKIKQKLLPGQKGKPAIRLRVEQVSLRYENLVVFVSEGKQDDSASELDESDCLAISEFTGFALGLDALVSVQFVAGGEEILAKWIASTIIQLSVPGSPDLLTDETFWELFLRRAGMNAFAAQVVIESLKAPKGVDASSPTKAGHFGLTAFVEMEPAERVARFGQICGQKLLERVSAVIDGKWKM